MTNRATLAQLRDMTEEQVNALPIDQIALLLEDVADAKAENTRLGNLLHASLAHRYSDAAALSRRVAGKDTGSVTINVGDLAIKCDLPKAVDWDQKKLADAVGTIRIWGEDPAEYVATEVKVAETKFNAWPAAIRKIFEPARTVGTGKATFKIERKKAA